MQCAMAIREIGESGVSQKWSGVEQNGMEQSGTEWNKIIVIKIKEKFDIITPPNLKMALIEFGSLDADGMPAPWKCVAYGSVVLKRKQYKVDSTETSMDRNYNMHLVTMALMVMSFCTVAWCL